MNKDFGCYCGFLADMIMKYAPEIKDAYNIDTLQQCRVFFYYRKFIGSPPCKRWTYFITVCKRQECNFLSWVMHLTFVTHIFLLYHIIRI